MGCWDAISDVGISTSFGYSSSGILTGSERPSTSHEQRFPETPLTRLTLLLVLIQAIIVITLEAVVAALFIRNVDMVQDTPAKGIPVYLVMFCTSQVFMGAVCWDAIWHKNSIQMYGFLIFNGASFAYSLFQFFQLEALFRTAEFDPAVDIDLGILRQYGIILIVIPTLLGVMEVVYGYLTWKLVKEFGWKMYKRIGADPHMRSIYQWYQILLMLIKFDLFFALTFSIQYLVLQLAPSDPEFAVTIVALPVAIVFSIAAIWGAKHENRPVMTAFVVLLLITIAYFVFKIVRMYQPSQRYKYTYTYKYLTFFAVICIVVGVAVLIAAIFVIRNFGEGLEKHLNDTESTLTRPRPSKLEEAETKPNTSLYSTTKALMSAQGVSLPDAAALKIPTNAVAAPQLSADGGGVDYNEVVNSGRI